MRKVHAYRNLNAGDPNRVGFVWSKGDGPSLGSGDGVIGHFEWITLCSVTLRCQPAGLRGIRKRSAETGKDTGRKVYAYLSGLDSAPAAPPADARPLTCNPFREGVFVWADEPLHGETAVDAKGERYTPRAAAPTTFDKVWLTPEGAFAVDPDADAYDDITDDMILS
jgi:hypothetical protein